MRFIKEDANRTSYKGYIIRKKKDEGGDEYFDIIKPSFSTVEPILDYEGTIEGAKAWIDSAIADGEPKEGKPILVKGHIKTWHINKDGDAFVIDELGRKFKTMRGATNKIRAWEDDYYDSHPKARLANPDIWKDHFSPKGYFDPYDDVDMYNESFKFNVEYTESGEDKEVEVDADSVDDAKKKVSDELNKSNVVVRNASMKTNVTEDVDDDFSMDVDDDDEGMDEYPPAPATNESTGVASIINGLIRDEWEAIDGYNSAIVAIRDLGIEDMVKTLEDIANEEHTHVGQLQAILSLVEPQASSIGEGEIEGNEQIASADESIPSESTDGCYGKIGEQNKIETVVSDFSSDDEF